MLSKHVLSVLVAALLLPLAAATLAAQPAAYDCRARITSLRPAPPPAPDETDPWQCVTPKNHKLSTALDWFRDSLEYCGIATSAYRDATRAAYRAAVRFGPKGWIVFMDADETVFDNSLYERERQRCGVGFSEPTWNKWLHAGIAEAVPGAAAFTQTVHALGGLIAIITNRDAAYDTITQANLKDKGIWFDYEIGQPAGTPSDKTARWQEAARSLAQTVGGTPKPVMWVGDQVTDFAILDAKGDMVRAMSQNDDGKGIGWRYFLIPNPLYGNWTKNPEN